MYESFDRASRKAYLDLLARGYRPNNAAKMCHVTMRTVRKAMERDPFFARAVAEATASNVDDVEEKLIELARSGDIQAIKFYLGAVKPEMYRPPSPNNILGVQVNQASGTLSDSPSGLSVDELRAQALELLELAANEHAQFTHQLPPFIDTTATEDDDGECGDSP